MQNLIRRVLNRVGFFAAIGLFVIAIPKEGLAQTCPNGVCEAGENTFSCPADCTACDFDFCCEPSSGENMTFCASDCFDCADFPSCTTDPACIAPPPPPPQAASDIYQDVFFYMQELPVANERLRQVAEERVNNAAARAGAAEAAVLAGDHDGAMSNGSAAMGQSNAAQKVSKCHKPSDCNFTNPSDCQAICDQLEAADAVMEGLLENAPPPQ